jgi:hypothetical protein
MSLNIAKLVMNISLERMASKGVVDYTDEQLAEMKKDIETQL